MSLRKGNLSGPPGVRRMYMNHFSTYQQGIRRIFRIWGQYPDLDTRNLSGILEYHVSAAGGVFHGRSILSSYDDKAPVQQKIVISVRAISCSGIFGRDVYWDILKR